MKRIHLSILRQLRLDRSRPACTECDLIAEITRLINKMKARIREDFEPNGFDWVFALRTPATRALAAPPAKRAL